MINLAFDTLQLTLFVPRGLEALTYFLCIIILKNRKRQPEKIDNKLTQIYIWAFEAWFTYMLIDTLGPVIGGSSINDTFLTSIDFGEQDYILFQGYTWEVPSLLIANFLRDVQLIFGFLFVYLSYRACLTIRYGSEEGVKRSKSRLLIASIVIAAIITITYDSHYIKIYSDYTLEYYTAWDSLGPLGYLGYFVYITIMLYNTVVLFWMYSQGRGNLTQQERYNLIHFCLGYLFFLIGLIYWIVFPLIMLVFQFSINSWIFQFLGHTFWMISPLAFLRALVIRK